MAGKPKSELELELDPPKDPEIPYTLISNGEYSDYHVEGVVAAPQSRVEELFEQYREVVISRGWSPDRRDPPPGNWERLLAIQRDLGGFHGWLERECGLPLLPIGEVHAGLD